MNRADLEKHYADSPYRKLGMSEKEHRAIAETYFEYGTLRDIWPPSTKSAHTGWTVFYPRPTRLTRPNWSDEVLHNGQEEWDEADRIYRNLLALDAANAKRQADELAAHQKQEAERQAEQDAARLETLTADLRRGYFSIPGATEEGFTKALPDLLEQQRRDAARSTEADDAARRVIGRGIKSAF